MTFLRGPLPQPECGVAPTPAATDEFRGRIGWPDYTRFMKLPFDPPLEPMLAKASDGLPTGDGWLFEPKWDGFRAIVFRDGDEVFTQSRDLKPLDRYFPELAEPLRRALPDRCIVDGEVVIAADGELQFESLLLRIHPAASRVRMLAEQSPASFVAWDLLALDDRDLRPTPQGERRQLLEQAFAAASGHDSVHLTPATTDRALAEDWFHRFEGAGLDGVVAKKLSEKYQPGKRAMLKIKHQRTADCVVAGFRWHKNGPGTHVGSLLLGLYDDDGKLQPRRDHLVVHVGPPGIDSDGAGAAPRERARGPPVAGVGRVGGRRRGRRVGPAAAGRHVALEPGQGPVVGAAPRRDASSRSRTTTSRATASATRRRSSAGARTSRRPTAVRPARGDARLRDREDLRRVGLSSRASSAAPAPAGRPGRATRSRPTGRSPGRAAPAAGRSVLRDVDQVDPDAGTRARSGRASRRRGRRPARGAARPRGGAPSSARGPRAPRPSSRPGRSR